MRNFMKYAKFGRGLRLGGGGVVGGLISAIFDPETGSITVTLFPTIRAATDGDNIEVTVNG